MISIFGLSLRAFVISGQRSPTATSLEISAMACPVIEAASTQPVSDSPVVSSALIHVGESTQLQLAHRVMQRKLVEQASYTMERLSREAKPCSRLDHSTWHRWILTYYPLAKQLPRQPSQIHRLVSSSPTPDRGKVRPWLMQPLFLKIFLLLLTNPCLIRKNSLAQPSTIRNLIAIIRKNNPDNSFCQKLKQHHILLALYYISMVLLC